MNVFLSASKIVCDGVRSAMHQARVHEVQRAAFVRRAYGLNSVAAHVANVALSRSHDVKSQRAVDPAKRRLADRLTLAPDHDEQSAPTPAKTFSGQSFEPFDQFRIIDSAMAILHRSLGKTDHAGKQTVVSCPVL